MRSSLSSPSGFFAFGFYEEGNEFVVGIWLDDKSNINVVWTANQDDPPISLNSTIEFTIHGGLLLRTSHGNDQNQKSLVDLSNPAVSASMLDSGGQNIPSTILTSSKSTLDHSSGRFHLELTNTGDLVAYPVNHTDAPKEFYWAILARTFPLKLSLSLEGVLQSGLRLKNQVKGFCSSNSSKANCYCFPRFDFMNFKMRFLGCYRSFNDEEGCKREELVMFYNISKMENTKLGGLPYAKLELNKEDCSKSCLYDCYCGVVLYLNKTCKKLKLPLMFRMEDHNEPASIVFVKWSPGNTNLSSPRISPPILHETVVIDRKKKLVTFLQQACVL
ncbi:hypothetical protein Patl1_27829 [Pistacia atlantica]|uniref:Uncharacterized protein n=1 Tax=Pistacia atlantica TaxID=434234 RepID=A0ACC1BFT7_9ROSI|nr:hypothetical protein Patl1_27829 [Pistacia atlantica]